MLPQNIPKPRVLSPLTSADVIDWCVTPHLLTVCVYAAHASAQTPCRSLFPYAAFCQGDDSVCQHFRPDRPCDRSSDENSRKSAVCNSSISLWTCGNLELLLDPFFAHFFGIYNGMPFSASDYLKNKAWNDTDLWIQQKNSPSFNNLVAHVWCFWVAF